MSERTYEKLRELIDVHPLGCPPAPEIMDLGMRLLQEKGKLEEFIKVNTL